jgi:LmbE family N-acetylglucosaminyl deacetylase
VIGTWTRALILAPHTDDGEFGCGGTIARLVESGCDVRYLAFSTAHEPETLTREVLAACGALGLLDEQLAILDYPVRNFAAHRQRLLDDLLDWKHRLDPDVVFCPCSADVHQDHQAVAQEAQRAFKQTTLLGYQLPWNCRELRSDFYIDLAERHVARKLNAIAQYASQADRCYASESYQRAWLTVQGSAIKRTAAEVFEVYQVVA